MLFGYFSTLKPDHFLLSIILEIIIKTIYFYAYYDPAKKTVRGVTGFPRFAWRTSPSIWPETLYNNFQYYLTVPYQEGKLASKALNL